MNPIQSNKSGQLDTADHSRDSSGMTYVYPVVSRRAGGVSIGINLNPNNACNWRCIYCQVPDLTRGSAPAIDLALLETELRALLKDMLHGDFMTTRVPEVARHIEDIAFSGNGEPTSAREFPQVVELVSSIRDEFELDIKLRLITNGSLIHRPAVLKGIKRLGQVNGETWFKLDAGTTEGFARINNVVLDPVRVMRKLQTCSEHCPTWVQTCCVAFDGMPLDDREITAWLDILMQTRQTIAGVHLYGLARPSLQAEAPRLERLAADWLEALAERIRKKTGLTVRVSP